MKKSGKYFISIFIVSVLSISYLMAFTDIFKSQQEIEQEKILKKNEFILSQAFQSEDFREALPVLNELAENENFRAMRLLGMVYQDNNGKVRRDLKKSFYWYKRAAFYGDDISKLLLGIMYMRGMGTPDPVWKKSKRKFQLKEAHDLFTSVLNKSFFDNDGIESADCTYTYSQYLLANWFYKVGQPDNIDLSQRIIQPNYDLVQKYSRKSAERGYIPSIYYTGYYYEEGKYGFERDLINAYAYYFIGNTIDPSESFLKSGKKRLEKILIPEQINIAKEKSKKLVKQYYTCPWSWNDFPW